MKRNVITVCDVLLYLITYLVFNFIVGIPLSRLISDTGNIIALQAAISSLCVIILFLALKWVWVKDITRRINWQTILTVILLAILLIIPVQLVEELLGIDMPGTYKTIFTQLLGSPWAFISVAVLTPIAEEFLFRGAILRRIHMATPNQWIAICISSLLFGLLHGNLAQFIHAFLIGMLLGWMYCRYKSLLPSILFHIINNSIAFILFRIMPDPDARLIDILKKVACG